MNNGVSLPTTEKRQATLSTMPKTSDCPSRRLSAAAMLYDSQVKRGAV